MTPKMLKIIPCELALALVAGCSGSDSPLAESAFDTVPPAAPVGVELRAYTGAEPWLAVEWLGNAEPDLAGYVVQRSLDDGLTWFDATAVITTTEFVDSYFSRALYRVAAVDISENQSGYSGLVSYVAPVGTPKLPEDAQGQVF